MYRSSRILGTLQLHEVEIQTTEGVWVYEVAYKILSNNTDSVKYI